VTVVGFRIVCARSEEIMETTIPVQEVPVVMCLAERNGVGMRITIDEAQQYVGSRFCGTCAARTPCYAYHKAQKDQGESY
jgi:hypothetical protein